MSSDDQNICRIHGRVVACISPGFVKVLVGPGVGLLDGGIPTDVPEHIIPADLRFPNREFILIFNRRGSCYVAIERLGE